MITADQINDLMHSI